MPEGPEVATIADQLASELVNKYITRAVITKKSRHYDEGIDGWTFPSVVDRIYAKGKRIIFELTATTADTKWWILSFLGMSGKWIFQPDDHSGIILDYSDGNDIFGTEHDKIYFSDCRKFGFLKVYTDKKSLDEYLSDKVGPDWLKDDISLSAYTDAIRNKRLARSQVAYFITNQRHFSGIGNYIKCEILWHARIAPNRTLGSLTDDEIHRLWTFSKSIIKDSYENNGCTIQSYLAPDQSKGKFRCLVYGQRRDPLGNEVIKSTFKDKRTTHWVPAVQV